MSAGGSSLPELVVALEPPDARDAARLARLALDRAAGAVLVTACPGSRVLLTSLPGVTVMALLPDISRLARQASAQGPVRATVERLRPGGVGALVRLVVTVVGHLPALVRRDFIGIVPALLELERASLGPVAPRSIALAAPLTDVLLAAGHRACFAEVVRFVRGRMHADAGFETLNLGHLLDRLHTWGIAPDFVIGPLNARGFRMKPSPAAALEAVRRSRIPVLAREVTAARTVPVAAGRAYARAQGAAGVVVTLDDLRTEARGGE